MTETLDAFERDQLRRAERTIRKGLRTFVQVGEALLTIRDARLYRETHPTFEAYCRDRWQLSKTHANRLAQAAAVMRELPAESAPTSERQARELAPLLSEPGVMRRAWTTVMHRTGGKPTAADVRDVVHETTRPANAPPWPSPRPPVGSQSPADPDASADAPGAAGAGAPADPLRGASAGATRSTEPPASHRAGEGGTGAQEGKPAAGPASGTPDSPPLAESGAPTGPRPKPEPASPHDAGPESGGTVAPSSSSQVDGADGTPPSAGPVAEGGAPVLTDAEIDEALGDQWSPTYLEGEGCRLALARITQGEPVDRAVARAIRLTCRPGRLPEHARAVTP